MGRSKNLKNLKSLKGKSDKYVHKLSCNMLDAAERDGNCTVRFSEDYDYSAARLYACVKVLAENYPNDCSYKRARVGKDSVYVRLLTKPQTDIRYVIDSLNRYGNSVISGGAVRQLGFGEVDSYISQHFGKKVRYVRPHEAYGASESEMDCWIVKAEGVI